MIYQDEVSLMMQIPILLIPSHLCPKQQAEWKHFAVHHTGSWLISDMYVYRVICIPLHGLFQQS